MCNPAGADLHHKQDIQSSQPDGFEPEEVGGQQPGTPARAGTPASSEHRIVAPGRSGRCPGSAGACRRPPGDRAGPAHPALGDGPTTGSPEPAGSPAHEALRRSADGQAGSDTSTSSGPGGGARPTACPAARSGALAVRPAAAGPSAASTAVRPEQPRPRDLPAQHGDLVPQHQNLSVLRRINPGQQGEPAHHLRSPRYKIRTATAPDHAGHHRPANAQAGPHVASSGTAHSAGPWPVGFKPRILARSRRDACAMRSVGPVVAPSITFGGGSARLGPAQVGSRGAAQRAG
jgi:hypothetical protein